MGGQAQEIARDGEIVAPTIAARISTGTSSPGTGPLEPE